ncbi:MAG: hotdog fold thioesterase [Paludibacter sp.]|nr:hotdog fold thioesterase [Paludibacter sp.]
MGKILTPEMINDLCKNTMIDHLGIEFIEASAGKVVARMPVDERTIQPAKRLHGGASMALAESVGSVGSFMLVDSSKFHVLGVEISGSHVGTTTEKTVLAIATIVHQGKSSHVWEIRVQDEKGTLVSVCRLTNRIIPIKSDVQK